MFQTCASVPTSGHLEALTRWRGLCGQPTNPIEEYQRGEAAASPLVCSPCSRSGAIFSQNIPIIFLCGGLPGLGGGGGTGERERGDTYAQ